MNLSPREKLNLEKTSISIRSSSAKKSFSVYIFYSILRSCIPGFVSVHWKIRVATGFYFSIGDRSTNNCLKIKKKKMEKYQARWIRSSMNFWRFYKFSLSWLSISIDIFRRVHVSHMYYIFSDNEIKLCTHAHVYNNNEYLCRNGINCILWNKTKG